MRFLVDKKQRAGVFKGVLARNVLEEKGGHFLTNQETNEGELGWGVREILEVTPLGGPFFSGIVGTIFGPKMRWLHSPGGFRGYSRIRTHNLRTHSGF